MTKSNKKTKEKKLTKKEKRFVKLSWELIEHKMRYYYFDYSIISDVEYDKLEQEYLQLCLDLKQPNTVVHKIYPGFEAVEGTGMMEIDMSRPSVMFVWNKIQTENLNRLES